MAIDDSIQSAPTGKLVQPTIRFESDNPHERRFARGELACFEDVWGQARPGV